MEEIYAIHPNSEWAADVIHYKSRKFIGTHTVITECGDILVFEEHEVEGYDALRRDWGVYFVETLIGGYAQVGNGYQQAKKVEGGYISYQIDPTKVGELQLPDIIKGRIWFGEKPCRVDRTRLIPIPT